MSAPTRAALAWPTAFVWDRSERATFVPLDNAVAARYAKTNTKKHTKKLHPRWGWTRLLAPPAFRENGKIALWCPIAGGSGGSLRTKEKTSTLPPSSLDMRGRHSAVYRNSDSVFGHQSFVVSRHHHHHHHHHHRHPHQYHRHHLVIVGTTSAASQHHQRHILSTYLSLLSTINN